MDSDNHMHKPPMVPDDAPDDELGSPDHQHFLGHQSLDFGSGATVQQACPTQAEGRVTQSRVARVAVLQFSRSLSWLIRVRGFCLAFCSLSLCRFMFCKCLMWVSSRIFFGVSLCWPCQSCHCHQ